MNNPITILWLAIVVVSAGLGLAVPLPEMAPKANYVLRGLIMLGSAALLGFVSHQLLYSSARKAQEQNETLKHWAQS